MPCPVCHHSGLVEIDVTVQDQLMTMHSCSSCTARWWDRDGEVVKLPKVLELATVTR